MRLGISIALFGLEVHNLLPCIGVNLKLAAAVIADISDSVGSVGILNQRPRRACLPHADHGDNRHNSARQVNQDKVLLADALVCQVRVNSAAEIVELSVGNTLGLRLVKENRCVWVFFCILFE